MITEMAARGPVLLLHDWTRWRIGQNDNWSHLLYTKMYPYDLFYLLYLPTIHRVPQILHTLS